MKCGTDFEARLKMSKRPAWCKSKDDISLCYIKADRKACAGLIGENDRKCSKYEPNLMSNPPQRSFSGSRTNVMAKSVSG